MFDASDDVISRADAQRVAGSVNACLEQLPVDQRDAIRLRVINELPYETVAERLQCTPECARMRVMRGLRTLKAEMGGGCHDVVDPGA